MVARALTYVDTSVWCAYAFNEPEQPGAVRWLAESDLDRRATAVWSRTEFASAAALKQRAKGQTRQAVVRARTAFDAALEMTHCLDIVSEDFQYAAELCRTSRSGLRAGDALHLAVALRHSCQCLASLDKAMNAAATELGLKPVLFD